MRTLILISLLILPGCWRQQQPANDVRSDSTTATAPAAQRPPENPSHTDSAKTEMNREMRNTSTSTEDTLEGTLYISGNEPFTRLTLGLGPQKSIYIDIDSARMKELWNHQGTRVRVLGTIKKRAMGDYINVRQFTLLRGE